MGYANDLGTELLRVLLYGREKTQKTWWACLAAAAGFNVVLLDGDGGTHILKQLPKEILGKILVVDIVDTNTRAVTALFHAELFKINFRPFMWDEQDKCRVIGVPKSNHSFIWVDRDQLDSGDVLIDDSYTALAKSARLAYAIEQQLEPGDASKTEWDGYGYEGNFLTFVNTAIKALKCHAFVIGHETVYEKWDRRDKKNPKLISQTTQMVSSSGPHAMTIGDKYSDILYFKRHSEIALKINTAPAADRMGGCRNIAPATYAWADLTPKMLLDTAKAKPSGKPCDGFVWFANGNDASQFQIEFAQRKTSAQMVKPSLFAKAETATPAAPDSPKVITNVGGSSFKDRLKLNKG